MNLVIDFIFYNSWNYNLVVKFGGVFFKIDADPIEFQVYLSWMDQNTIITLIRHGETEWNLSGRWQGHADSPLSSRGGRTG